MKGEIEFWDEFPSVPAKAWKQKIQADLKGADYQELVWESAEGIKVKPFYTKEDLPDPLLFSNPVADTWKVGQTIAIHDSGKAHAALEEALEGGAESLALSFSSQTIAPDTIFEKQDLEKVEIHLHFSFLDAGYIQKVIDSVAGRVSKLFLHLDIIGHFASGGNWHSDGNSDQHQLRKILEKYAGTDLSVASIDMALYQEAGANRVQQLAYTLAHAHEYLHIYGPGLFKEPCFQLGVGGDFFFEIAKIRALKTLWTTLASEYGLPGHCTIAAHPVTRNKTVYDYNNNMLRTTMESLAAVTGGADTVFNTPYDSLFHFPNPFGDRIARNQLLLLKHESRLGLVKNPADGSYYIEALTSQMAEKALALFKQIEAGGGLLKQLDEHIIQRKIRENAKKVQQGFDKGEKVLIGSNRFVDPNQKMKPQVQLPLVRKAGKQTRIEPLSARRLSGEIELNRLENE